ncbi:hypothetical protein KP509_27G024900 [Ceratopteris richardii]|uniref:non-specific serine/threonine protein kinase n=1 Tax=Ceratopteris richardii TaxID=49495 RepID=A0A8T2RH76_CERRI|nr:hypothetical protein KP509_27G024900 [Ceratopteris richardii]KAH7294925.1 hypothetical protein KP509_27G024900 [Ceratopteris richardii]
MMGKEKKQGGNCFTDCFRGAPRRSRRLSSKVNSLREAQLEGSDGLSQGAASDINLSSSFDFAKGKDLIPGDTSGPYIAAQTFTFRDLMAATRNFRDDCLLGEGGFGRVYKGRLENSGQVVAVKQLDRNGLQGNREFLVEVLILSLLHHPNLVNLIGYCADGDQRLLVYEYMPYGSLEDHLFDLAPGQAPLDWNTRIRIAAGAASGLEYLHDKADPPVIYRDFKSSNILLDNGFQPKLSDFGLAKLGPVGDKSHVSTRVMGTYGYCAPEYAMTGQLTVKSDVYSFGVVLLELITGRRAIDNTRPQAEQNLVQWARPMFKDRRKFPQMADPLLQGRYPMRGMYQALAVAAMCLQEQGETRPLIADVVTALTYLASQTYEPATPGSPTSKQKKDRESSPMGVKQGMPPSLTNNALFSEGPAEEIGSS